MIKRLLIVIALLCTTALPAFAVQPQPVFAVDILDNSGSACNSGAKTKPSFCSDNQAGSKSNPIYGQAGILTAIINVLAKLVGLVSVVVIVISGIRMIMSQDAAASANARRGVISAVIGLVIALMAQALVSFVLSKF